MRTQGQYIQNERGFVLVAALLIMLVLTILGIAATTNTSIELQIAGNDKVHKMTFYQAEAGALLGSELIEENLNCSGTFNNHTIAGTIHAYNLSIGSNDSAPYLAGTKVIGRIGDADIISPWDGVGAAPTQQVDYLYFMGQTNTLPGGALQMAAGYEGKGKSSAQGGVAKFFDIYSQHKGLTNSESIILYGWRHIVGSEEGCIY